MVVSPLWFAHSDAGINCCPSPGSSAHVQIQVDSRVSDIHNKNVNNWCVTQCQNSISPILVRYAQPDAMRVFDQINRDPHCVPDIYTYTNAIR